MEFCFNELCLATKAKDQYQANEWICSLLDLLRKAYLIDNLKPVLRTDSGLHGLALLDDFTVAMWLHSTFADREKWILLRSIIDRSPYLDSELDKLKFEAAVLHDFFYKNQRAIGLGCAWLLDGIALSLPTDDEWVCSNIEIQVDTVNGDCDVQSANQKVNHVSQMEHLEVHALRLQSLEHYYREMPNLVAMQEKSTRLFLFLRFGDEALKWLESQRLSAQHFHLIIRNLYRLNQFFEQQVSNGNFSLTQIPNCSNESESTRNQYADKRLFWFGVEKYYCEWHLKIHSLNVRIHFKPDFENNIAYVGYIGIHLPTTKYN